MVTALESLKDRAPSLVIAAVVRILFAAGASRWSVQDKGNLVAAVKLQLSERETK